MAQKYLKLNDFLKSMHADKALRARLATNPAAVIKSSGLSPAHKKLVETGDSRAIAHAAVDEHLEDQTPDQPFQTLSIKYIPVFP